MQYDDKIFEETIFRQCITLRNGKRICKPKGQAFMLRIKRKKVI